MPMDECEDGKIRIALFQWLNERSTLNEGIFNREELAHGFHYNGRNITLVGPTGIWRPMGFTIPISIATTSSGPYDDGFTSEGFLTYKYRGTDPNHPDNKGLREACRRRTPLVYFHSIKPGKYVAVYPVFIMGDDPANLEVKAAIDPSYDSIPAADFAQQSIDGESAMGIRRYAMRLTKTRLHQSTFREFVLDAYSGQCAICRLQHRELLDAAHIIPDNEEEGDPIIANGLSLCKIHHAAFDSNFIGITPDYIIKVRQDLLDEVDGPMLEFGLKRLEDTKIILPVSKKDYPTPKGSKGALHNSWGSGT